mmetsp:Transcript_14539/g.33836  ORF Transcript_14539/g.33836 Transcript_14539/m.33836 type:complete len:327 (+) Transcript_14539:104-1084(+)
MSPASLDASLTRLENIKGNKQMYNKNKIAEAEALAAEALRMANEAKLAAARLAEVKKTLLMFSNKLEKAEQSVQKGEVKTVLVEKKVPADAPQKETPEKVDAPVEVAAVEKQPEEETAPVEEVAAPVKEETSAVVSKTLVNDDVVKVVEVKQPKKVVVKEPKESSVAAVETPAPVIPVKTPAPVVPVETPAPVVPATYNHDIVEDFLDHLGVDKMCGVDDETLGFSDRPAPPPAPKAPEIFENPTKVVYKSFSSEELLREESTQETLAAAQRKARALQVKSFQRTQVNTDFADPFGVDHDELVLCGKLADLCEPPEFDDIYDTKYQ